VGISCRCVSVCLYVCTCLSVCYTPVLYQNGGTDRTVFVATYATVCFKKIRVSLKIRVFPFETLFQTLDLENLAVGEYDIKSDSSRFGVDST